MHCSDGTLSPVQCFCFEPRWRLVTILVRSDVFYVWAVTASWRVHWIDCCYATSRNEPFVIIVEHWHEWIWWWLWRRRHDWLRGPECSQRVWYGNWRSKVRYAALQLYLHTHYACCWMSVICNLAATAACVRLQYFKCKILGKVIVLVQKILAYLAKEFLCRHLQQSC